MWFIPKPYVYLFMSASKGFTLKRNRHTVKQSSSRGGEINSINLILNIRKLAVGGCGVDLFYVIQFKERRTCCKYTGKR